MVTRVEVVRYGIGFGKADSWQADCWQEARPRATRVRELAEDPLAPARGAIFGLALSAVLWAGLIVAAQALFHIF